MPHFDFGPALVSSPGMNMRARIFQAFVSLKSGWKKYADESTVLVYQMGKVGSTSLEESLPGSIHAHTFYSNFTCEPHARQVLNSWWQRAQWRIGEFFKRAAIRSRKKVKIISLVRDPYARNVSMFFQDLPHWLCRHMTREAGRGVFFDNRSVSMSHLFDAFDNAFDHYYGEAWFDKELFRLTGVDVFSYPFDPQVGHVTIKMGKYEIFIVRLESLSASVGALSAFVGYDVDLRISNDSAEKWYACVYERFLRAHTPPENYVSSLYESKLASHFYSKSELERLKGKHSVKPILDASA